MRGLFLGLIRAYVWMRGMGERRRIKKKMDRLRKSDPYNYPMF